MKRKSSKLAIYITVTLFLFGVSSYAVTQLLACPVPEWC